MNAPPGPTKSPCWTGERLLEEWADQERVTVITADGLDFRRYIFVKLCEEVALIHQAAQQQVAVMGENHLG